LVSKKTGATKKAAIVSTEFDEDNADSELYYYSNLRIIQQQHPKVAELLNTYLTDMATSESSLNQTLADSQRQMVNAILVELNSLGTHADRQQLFDNELWGLILILHFKASKGLTDKEIRLYLLRQEKAGKRSRSEEALERRQKKIKDQTDLLYECFMEWQNRPTDHNKPIEHEDDNDDASVGSATSKIARTLMKEKGLSQQQAKSLTVYDNKLLGRAGALLCCVK
jgi:hypothetical protein